MPASSVTDLTELRRKPRTLKLAVIQSHGEGANSEASQVLSSHSLLLDLPSCPTSVKIKIVRVKVGGIQERA